MTYHPSQLPSSNTPPYPLPLSLSLQKKKITTQLEKIPWYSHVWRNLIESNKLLSTFYHHFLVLFISTFFFLGWFGLWERGGKQKGANEEKARGCRKKTTQGSCIPITNNIPLCEQRIQIQVPTSKYLIFQNIYVIGTIYLFGDGLERMSLIILFKKKTCVKWWPCHEKNYYYFKQIPNERHIFIYIRNI